MNTQWIVVVWYEDETGQEGIWQGPFEASSEPHAIGLCYQWATKELKAKRIIGFLAYDTVVPCVRDSIQVLQLAGAEKFTLEQIQEIWAMGIKQWEEKK